MDKTIRRNQICVVGLPRCDFVFSSTRACFIAYGFRDSTLEMNILRHLLENRGIQPVEAGGALAPGQNAFCAKICSKIITSQFCVVLINNEVSDEREIPNANVNMEYGLMLGFNKYVIPFQRAYQTLPFNVAGLDTIKYSNADFERLATDAIDQAIRETQQDVRQPLPADQLLEVFLLSKKALVTAINSEGDRNMYQMGSPLGFNLLNDFTAIKYTYLGNFTALRPEVILWRVKMLTEILAERRDTVGWRVKAGMATETQAQLMEEVLSQVRIWIVVTSTEDKNSVEAGLRATAYPVEVFSLDNVRSELENLGRIGA
jgi:hypothetical protein